MKLKEQMKFDEEIFSFCDQKKILNAILIQSQIPDFYSLQFKAEAG